MCYIFTLLIQSTQHKTHMCTYTGLSSFLGLPLWLLYLRVSLLGLVNFNFSVFCDVQVFLKLRMLVSVRQFRRKKKQFHNFRWKAGNRRPQWSVSFFSMVQCHYRWSRLEKISAFNPYRTNVENRVSS